MHIDEALDCFRRFLKDLRVTNQTGDMMEGFIQFQDDELGGLRISGEEYKEYISVIDNITGAVAHLDRFSRRGIEDLTQKAILYAVKPKSGMKEIPDSFVKEAVRWLRNAVNAEPRHYIAFLPVTGIEPRCLPNTVGKVTFLRSDKSSLAIIRRPVTEIIASMPGRREEINSIRKDMRDRINYTFNRNIIAEIEVAASDDKNAEQKAVRECRKTIETINFYADVFTTGGSACVALLGEGNLPVKWARTEERQKTIVILRIKGATHETSIKHRGMDIAGYGSFTIARGPLAELVLPRKDSQQALDYGLARLSQILAKHPRTSFEERILASCQWAGRATVDMRPEESFLLYMIALEGLVLGSDTKTNITHQLKLKAAHLIRKTKEERKKLFSRLGHLYGVRSRIVHSGSFEVTDAEVREIRYYTKLALLTVLVQSPFRDMTSEDEFDRWLARD